MTEQSAATGAGTDAELDDLQGRARFLAAGQDDPHSETITELCAALAALRRDRDERAGCDDAAICHERMASTTAALLALEADNAALRRELDEAREAIAWANNSLFGSHGFFLSLNGGPANPHHLDEPIERLKADSREAYQTELALRAANAQMAAALREAKLQIEYLHEKFGGTGSGAGVLAKIDAAFPPAAPGEPSICDCERGANGLGMVERECDCAPASPSPGLDDDDRKRIDVWRCWLANGIVEEKNFHVIAWLIGLVDRLAERIATQEIEIRDYEAGCKAQANRIADLEAIAAPASPSPGLRQAVIEECAKVAEPPCPHDGSDYDKQAFDIRTIIARNIRALSAKGSSADE